MAEQIEGALAPVETQHAHILGIDAKAISTDNAAAMLVLIVGGETPEDPPRKLALTLPVSQLGWFRGIIHDLAVEADRKTVPQGALLMHGPKEMSVGHSDEMRGVVVITWDHKLESEAHYMLNNLAALKLCEMIKADVMPRLTLEERQQMRMLQPPQRGVLGPDGRPVS